MESPKPYERYILTYRDARMHKYGKVVGYIDMKGRWRASNHHLIRSRVVSWEKEG